MSSSTFGKVKKIIGDFIREIKKDDYKKLRVKRKTLLISSAIVVALIISGVLVVNNVQGKGQVNLSEANIEAQKVFFGGKEVGIVISDQKIDNILQEVQKELTQKHELEILIDQDITFESTQVDSESITSISKVKENIKNNLSYEVYAYALYIDGKEFAILESDEVFDKLLEDIKMPYINKSEEQGFEIEEIEIVENVEIKIKKTPLSEILDYDTVFSLVQKGTTEEKIHTVENGESYWTIAHKYDLSVEDLEKANPGKSASLIHPGDELSLIVPKPYLTVATYENETFTQKIPFDKEVEKSSSLYSDQRVVKVRGTYGEKEIFAKVQKHNGIVVDKEILKEVVIADPKPQIELQGTKKLPPKKGTGIFMRPTRGTITSRYGMRWGRMHYGLDLGSRVGTPIKAADGGVVTFAGWSGNYGLMVEIDHGAGFKTRYAHCSKIYVKVGQKVYKDKTIAAVGNTGRSTGPHVHFEVRKYDVPQNPLSYIGKQYR